MGECFWLGFLRKIVCVGADGVELDAHGKFTIHFNLVFFSSSVFLFRDPKRWILIDVIMIINIIIVNLRSFIIEFMP